MPHCVHIGNCAVHEVLGDLAGYIKHTLSGTTLDDLLSDQGPESPTHRRNRVPATEPGRSSTNHPVKPHRTKKRQDYDFSHVRQAKRT
jgi:hypothetical protein